MVGYYNQDIPSGELENNSNQKKYTINRSPKGDCIISRPVCALMVIGAILLAVLAGLLVFLFVPRCTGQETPAAIVQREKEKLDMIDESLPKDVLPMHYRIQLIPNLFSEPPLTNGAVSILLNVTEDTDRVVFHAKDLNIDKSSIVLTRIVDDKSVKIAGQNYNKDNQKYTIVFDETLKKNETYNLDVKFVGKINDQMQGFYRSRYEDGGKKEVMVSTQFSPTDARRAFPCFDEPSFKAKFTISIARPTNMTSLSNMPVRDKGQINIDKSDTVWDTYEETPLMSTYLVAFVVSNLSPFKYNSSEKLFTIWSRRDFLEQTRYGLDTVSKLLQYYENYFNINFPLPKIDIVAVPDFGYSAMENWGLITFREKVLLIDERSATLYDKRETAYVMAHELAHQWFGNLVTPCWWNDLWLKEGFATYLGYLGVHQIEPTWQTIDEFVYDHTYEAFKTDSLASSRPVSNDVHNNVQIRQQFDAISYSKGASLIRMLNHFLGNTRFKQGLINYLNRYRYSNADRDDLWNSFTLQEGDGGLPKNVSLSDVMGTWLLQPGFPVIFANGNVTNQSITIRQRRFLLVSENRTETWWVPVSASSDLDPSLTETTPKLWLGNSTEPIAFSQRFRNWYLLNMLQTGYYIVNYDERNWGALTSNIMSFNPPIRAQLISDSMDLARANLLSYSIPLQLIAEMTRADVNINDYLPFLTAFDKLEFLHDILYTTSTYEDFNIFMQRVFNHAFDNARLDTILPKNYVRERIQRIVLYWACKSPESSCTTDARFAYRRWMTEKQQVNPNIREVVYCTAIREGNEADWTFAYKMYFQTKVTAEKELLLKSLGCSNKPWVLSKFLDFTLSNATGVRKQDGALIFQSVASNPAGHQLAFNFLRNNWNALRKQYGDGFKILSRMVEALPKYMNTQYFLDELKSFQMKNLDNLGSAEQALDRCIEIVKANVEWTRQNLKILDDLLKDFNRRFLS